MREKKVKTTENNGLSLRRILTLFVRPVALLILGASVFSFSLFKNNPFTKVTTIVIDAGHGGKDPGCHGAIANEKEVTLSVALKLGKLIEENLKDVKVIYTRRTDVFVELEERAMIANRNNADLFISIHCNAASYMETRVVKGKKKKVEVINPKPYGSETYVMGIKNEAGKANVVKRENSAMLLEDNYKTTYSGFDPNSEESYIIMSMWAETFVEQSGKFAANIQKEYKSKAGRIDKGVKRESLWVLWRTKMPSVLTEVGYLTNPEEEKFISSEKGQHSLAAGLFRAFRNYKNEVEGTNLTFNDEIENMEPVTNENIAKGDTAYMREIEEYRNDSDAISDTREKLKQLYRDANQYFVVGDYNNAETKYNEIKVINETDKTAKEKLAEIKKIRTNYVVMTDKADKLYTAKKFSEAKKIYGDAQVLMPKEKYPTQRIKDCETAIKNGGVVNTSDADFLVLMNKGEEMVKLKKFDDALTAYKKASSINPADVGAKDKIRECEEAQKKNGKEIKYASLITEADKLFKDGSYAESKKKYFEAAMVDPENSYPKTRIEEITGLMDAQSVMNNESKYSQLVNKGNSSIIAKDYANAKNNFSEALMLFPDRSEPKKKIAECDSFINRINEVKAMVLKFDGAIKNGDKHFSAKNWSGAKASYEEALQYRNTDSYCKSQITKCDAALGEKVAMQKSYEEAMKSGEDFLAAKDYLKAKESFNKALSLSPGDTLARTKLTECSKLINAGAEKTYVNEIAMADTFFMNRNFNSAIEHYKKASSIKPPEEYPKFQIRLSEKSLVWQKQSEEYKSLIDAAESAAKDSRNEEAVTKYKSALNYLNNAKENKTKFKPTVEEVNKRMEELSKSNIKPDTGSVANKVITTETGDVVQIKVQFTQSSKALDLKSSKFSGINKVSFYQMNGMYKYTAGVFYTVEDAAIYRDKLKGMGYADAFLVAFRNDQRIDIKTALELLSLKKNP